jgi:hypothetical protein
MILVMLLVVAPTAPAAQRVTPPVATIATHAPAVLAETFTWSEFIKFWRKQFGKTSGVVGSVLAVASVAFLIVLSKGRKL